MGTPSGAKMTITRDDKRIDGTEKFTAEQALRPRQAKGKLKFVQNCDEGSKIVFRRTPMDRYTDTVCVVDEEGQTLGNPWTEVIAKDFQSMTQTFQVEGFQGPCTYVCCPYTQTVVWAKTSGSKEATPLLKGHHYVVANCWGRKVCLKLIDGCAAQAVRRIK